MNFKRLDGQIVGISNATFQIGRATAKLLAGHGDTVALVDIDGQESKYVAGEINSADGRTLAITADVAAGVTGASFVIDGDYLTSVEWPHPRHTAFLEPQQ